MPFPSPSLPLPALSSGHYGQGFLRSCLHHRLPVHLGALPHHSEVRDATHLSTPPGPGWGAAPSLAHQHSRMCCDYTAALAPCLWNCQVLGVPYTHKREAESPSFLHLGCGWLGCADRKMHGKVRSILCGEIFALHKAPVLSKVFVPCDNLSGTVKRT